MIAIPEPAPVPVPEAAADAAPTLRIAVNEDAPTVMALRMLQKMIIEARRDYHLRSYAELDLRVVATVLATLGKNPADAGAVQWLRQLALSWHTKMRGEPKRKFTQIFDFIDLARK